MPQSYLYSSFEECRQVLEARLADPAPGRIQLLTGPRQVGKTTLLLGLAERLVSSASYAACDGPEAATPGFWERLWARVAEEARGGSTVTVLLDEVQHLEDWAARLKTEWDRIRRRNLPIHVVATGSSALRVGKGSRESLAGRFERITLTHWSAASLSAAFGLSGPEAADLVVRQGAYPGAAAYRDDPRRCTAYLRDAIVEPAIGRDILALGHVRKPALLRQVFAVCTGAPAQIVSLQKMQGQLRDAGALETIAHYLALLHEAYLVAPLRKYGARPLRQRAAPPKLIALSNALLAATDPRGVPAAETDPARYGAWVENACIAHAVNSGQDVTYWREEPLEVDAVIDGSWGRWAIEVKTARFDERDLRGLLEFTKRYPSYRPLVLGPAAGLEAAERAGVSAMRWKDFLLEGPPAGS
ncbi:MAG: AAA family ATPase [Actinomycetota bacterium]